MFGGLDDSFIMDGDALNGDNLFGEDTSVEAQETQEVQPVEIEPQKEETITTESEPTNAENLFGDSESVGSEEDTSSNGEDTVIEDSGTSPNNNFYSTTAKAFKDDGVFPELDDDTIKNIKTAEDFSHAIEQMVHNKLDERQRRIDEALNLGIEPNEISIYEQTLSNLNGIDDTVITDETDRGETIRKNLIYQDFINKGYSKERAEREIKKSFDAGTDIDDAKDALESNKEYFNKQYTDLINNAKEEEKSYQEALKKEAEELKKSMLEDKEIFDGVTLTPKLRKEAFENITKPVHKTENGEVLTAIQKYEMDNPVQFRKYLSVFYTMTNGFTDINPLIQGKVKKAVRQNLREIEHTINTTSRNTFGNPTFVGNASDDDNSYAGKGWNLDV